MSGHYSILIVVLLVGNFVGLGSMLIGFANAPAVLISGADIRFRGTARYMIGTIAGVVFQSVAAITLSALIISYTRYITYGKWGYIFIWMFGIVGAIYPMWQTRSNARIERLTEPEAYTLKEATHRAIPYSLALTVVFTLLFVFRPPVLDALYYWLLALAGLAGICTVSSMVMLARRKSDLPKTPEDVPLFQILEESLTMILGDNFEALAFDPQLALTEEETDYAEGFAKPFAVAMLFNELLKRLKETQVDITAERLKAYFTESARDVYWRLGQPDANEQADHLISLALDFLDSNLVFDIDDNDLEPDDEPPVKKFLDFIFPDYCLDDPLQQKKIFIVTLFAGVIEDAIKGLTSNIFVRAKVTL